MNIHLIRTPDVDSGLIVDVTDFIGRFPGPARFILHEKMAEVKKEAVKQQEWEDEQLFHQFESLDVSLRSTVEVVSWEDLFEICKEFRVSQHIPDHEPVILLNGIDNDQNWFSAGSGEQPDFFIQTNRWDLYVDGDARYPITYQLFYLVLMSRVYPDYRDAIATTHRQPIGCIHDFCGNKKEIGLKLRTADICPDCLNKMEERKVDPLLIRQVFQAMEDIRGQLLFREKFKANGQASTLRIEGRNKRIILADLGNLEIHLTPIEKTVYLFFLNHPEGVLFPYMTDHLPELRKIYGMVSNTDMIAHLENRAMALSRNQDECLSQAISRIRRKFEEALGEDLAKPFVISGQAGQKRRILIDRNLVRIIE